MASRFVPGENNLIVASKFARHRPLGAIDSNKRKLRYLEVGPASFQGRAPVRSVSILQLLQWASASVTDVPPKSLSMLLDLDETNIRKHARNGIMVRAGKGLYVLEPSVRNYVKHLREIAAIRFEIVNVAADFSASDAECGCKLVLSR